MVKDEVRKKQDAFAFEGISVIYGKFEGRLRCSEFRSPRFVDADRHGDLRDGILAAEFFFVNNNNKKNNVGTTL